MSSQHDDSSNNIHSLPVGFSLSDYRVEGILGQGAFGITYLATDMMLNRKVAIKEYFPREFAARDGTFTVRPAGNREDRDNFSWGLSRFLEEARVLALFDHPNIVPVRRFFEANGTAYLVMDYCDGTPLDKFITTNGPLTSDQLNKLIYPLLDGLEKIHKANFLHRDIKPANIFIKSDGAPVLLDFGAARQEMLSHSRSVTSMATPGYAAFEQYSTHGKQGPWTDIYGLGATLYRATTGEKPQDAPDRILEDFLVPSLKKAAGRYNERILVSIDSAMAVRPEDRPQSVGEWRRMFGILEKPIAIASTPSPSGEATVKVKKPPAYSGEIVEQKPKGKTLTYSIAAIAIVGLIAGGIALNKLSGSSDKKTETIASTPIPPQTSAPKVAPNEKVQPKVAKEPEPKPITPPKESEPKVAGLPPCPGTPNASTWTNCFGTINFPPKDNAKGEKYVGEFKNALFEGKGTYYYATGATYTGEFKANQREGNGNFVTPDGYKYSGGYHNNKFSGNGTLLFPNGDKYVGHFSDGMFNGNGTYTFPSGQKYVGNYVNDKSSGYGTMYYPDGRKYVGNFVDGLFSGEGTMYATNGTKVYSGQWENGKAKGVDTAAPNSAKNTADNLAQCNSYAVGVRKILPKKLDNITTAREVFCYMGSSKPVFVYKYDIDSPLRFEQDNLNTLREKLRTETVCKPDVKLYLPIVDLEYQYIYGASVNNYAPGKTIGKLTFTNSDCP